MGMKVTRRRALIISASVGTGATLASRTMARLPDLASVVQRDMQFDRGWKFLLGDRPGAHLPEFDDGDLRDLDLPHDWSFEDRPGAVKEAGTWTPPASRWNPIERTKPRAEITAGGPIELALVPPAGPNSPPRPIGPFDPANTSMGWGVAWTVGGVGWYRKRFAATDLLPGQQVELRFDGIYMVSEVWVNGISVGRNLNGYLGFVCDLTPHLHRDGPNVVAVRVANEGNNARWYSGSGIYRHVWLSKTGAVRIPYGGVATATRAINGTAATIAVSAEVENRGSGDRSVRCDIVIRDAQGRAVATTTRPVELSGKSSGRIDAEMAVSNARLWSPETPDLYEAEITVHADSGVSDLFSQRFGIRVLSVSPETGFQINGKTYKLRGACIHHDNGILGAAAFDLAERRKVEILKANGFNAIRTSHNPFSPAFLDVCDELGMIVMGETFDFWEKPKFWKEGPEVYFKVNWRKDLVAMIRRDRNRPSIAFWCIGNEIPEAGSPRGVELAGEMRDTVRCIDATRFITNALLTSNAGKVGEGARSKLDVIGYNYQHEEISKDHETYPHLIFISTESYPRDANDIWRKVERNSWYIGDFVWTALEYLGEVGVASSRLQPIDPAVPMTARSSAPYRDGDIFQWDYPAYQPGCGDIDLIGRKRPPSFYRDVVWRRSKLELFVQRPTPAGKRELLSTWGWPDELASWTWAGQEGSAVVVRAYTSGDEVRLILNGAEVARKSVGPSDQITAAFQIDYKPGELIAVAYDRGREIARKSLVTTGAPARIRLSAEQERIGGQPGELAYVFADILDAAGRPVADAQVPVNFSAQGAARLLCAGSANPFGVESFQDATTLTYQGTALAIFAPTKVRGDAVIAVSGPGGLGDRLTIRVG
jgi:beta-galactosidase